MRWDGYPVLKEDIFFGKVQTPAGLQVKIRNTTTEKDFKANSATIALLDLCTGTRSVDEIITCLCEQSGEPREALIRGVDTILTVLQEKGVITVEATRLEKDISRVKNVKNYFIESAQIEITNRCNLSCLHCINDSGEPYPDELTTEEVLSVIDDLSAVGVHRITISGGEPLLHPDLFTIVEHARKAPMTVDIFTNGTLMTEEHVKKFKELGVRRFAVSIDSLDEEVHDRLRGKKGALRKTLGAVNLLLKNGFWVRPSISVTQLNKSIVDILKYFKEKNLTDYQVGAVQFSGRGLEGITVSPEEYYQVLAEGYTYLKKEFPEGIREIHEREGGCGIAYDRIGIKADGTVLPCPGCHEDMGVGKVRTCDLEEIWEKKETEMLRNMRVEDDQMCSGCRYLAFCGGCVANAFILERKLQCYNPYNCAVLRAYDEVIGLRG